MTGLESWNGWNSWIRILEWLEYKKPYAGTPPSIGIASARSYKHQGQFMVEGRVLVHGVPDPEGRVRQCGDVQIHVCELEISQ